MAYVLNETINVPRGPQKFRELILYVSSKCQHDPTFGAVKLNKLLYYADFRAFERFGTPITGVRYWKLQNGPVPKALPVVRDQLEQEGAIRIETDDLGNGYQRTRVVAQRDAAVSLFGSDEIALIDETIEELWGQSATEVSDASHDIRWRSLHIKDNLPYEFAFLSDEPVTAEDNARTEELAARFGW